MSTFHTVKNFFVCVWTDFKFGNVFRIWVTNGFWIRIQALDFHTDLVGLVEEVPHWDDALHFQVSGRQQVGLDRDRKERVSVEIELIRRIREIRYCHVLWFESVQEKLERIILMQWYGNFNVKATKESYTNEIWSNFVISGSKS